jgi:hypothetical protein
MNMSAPRALVAFASLCALPAFAAPPTVSTSPATEISLHGATLNGSINPNGESTNGWFRLATSSPGTCNDTFGQRVPSSFVIGVGSGTTSSPYSFTTGGLSAGTTYYYCAIAKNASGTAFGALVSFNTAPATAPTVTTGVAGGVGTSYATLHAQATSNGAATVGWFRYSATDPGVCSDGFGTRAPTTGGAMLGVSEGNWNYSQSISGLSPGTTYYYCAIAENSVGKSFGALLTFSTRAAPTVTTTGVTAVTTTSATLQGTANPHGLSSTGYFRYSTSHPGTCDTTFGIRAPTTGGTALGAGTTAQPYDQNVTGLSAGTTYYYCALASNSEGTGVGAVMSFTTGAAPLVTTTSATLVTSASATLNGSANPRGDATTGWFRYGAVSPGSCNATFGIRAPATGGTSLGAGTTPVTYAQAITGLQPGTTYYFCAIAANAWGTAFGALQTFTTPSSPTVTTSAATLVGSTTATLNASANPQGSAATGWLRYHTASPGTCNDTFGTRAPASGGTALGSGSSAVAFSQAVTGLQPGTTYFFCGLASNAVGTSGGGVLSFTTQGAPVVSTSQASSITATSATLNGTANPNGAATTAWFRYHTANPGSCNDTFGTRAPGAGGTSLGAGSGASPYSQNVAGLQPGTTYWVCAVAENGMGKSFGAPQTFRTLAAPTVTTTAATNVTPLTATINATAIPNGATTVGWFRFATADPGSCNDSFGFRAPQTGGLQLGEGTTAVPYAQALGDLQPGATYYYCALASNQVGTSFGELMTFSPAVLAPVVTTLPATETAARGAVFQGTANPQRNTTLGWFRYDTTLPSECSDTFGTRVPATDGLELGAGSATVPFELAVEGLKANVRYHYCAVAANLGGVAFGGVESFTTLTESPTVATLPASLAPDGTATLHGTANPNGNEAQAWFRYDTEHPQVCNFTFGNRGPPEGIALGAGHEVLPLTHVLPGLAPGSYHYCAIAVAPAGITYGQVFSFDVPGGAEPGCGCGSSSSAGTMSLLLLGVAGLLLANRRTRRRRT